VLPRLSSLAADRSAAAMFDEALVHTPRDGNGLASRRNHSWPAAAA